MSRLAIMFVSVAAGLAAGEAPCWPEIAREQRPWTYNWWPASAVDPQSISNEFRRYAEAGLGGVHIIPIYGVRGAESRAAEYLSPQWLERFACAAETAKGLGLGLDMTTGSGWCFGGPQVERRRGGWRFETRVIETRAGEPVTNRFPLGRLLALQALGPAGDASDLVPRVGAEGRLNWAPGVAGVRLVALLADCDKGQAVKRAGPGGKGLMINPFDPAAMAQFLEPFSRAFPLSGDGVRPRAMYHDSYEYFGASWCDGFLEAFARKRGYPLQSELAAFAGLGDPDRCARVKADYRETLSDLMVEDVFPVWTSWCRERGILTRNEAHGAPGNLLDLYALADIPETEMFGHGGADPLVSRFDADFGKADRNPLVSKLASSAAHVKGGRLASAEFGTWLAEHFHETPEEIKCLADLMFVSGVNHLFYHGTCFSADDAAWPGWLFYASTQMNPRNPIWHDAPLLNAYLARVQAVLQSGQPSNEVLLYWPLHDFWHEDGPHVRQLTVHDPSWLEGQPVGRTAAALWRARVGFDYVSDRLLAGVGVKGGRLQAAGGSDYAALVVPPCRLMPPETFERIVALAGAGAAVVFCDGLPEDAPGWGGLSRKRERLSAARAGLGRGVDVGNGLSAWRLGGGAVYAGRWEEALRRRGVRGELEGAPEGLLFVRRRQATGHAYLLVNQGVEVVDGWLRLSVPAREGAEALAMDALSGRCGAAETRAAADGRLEVRAYLEPAASLIVKTGCETGGGTRSGSASLRGEPFLAGRPGEALLELRGPWEVRFVSGGPVLPGPLVLDQPASWTRADAPEVRRFGGTAVYRTVFEAPAAGVRSPVLVDLGQVEVSARVRLNGQDVGCGLMRPYRVLLPGGLQAGQNTLEVEVTNLGANRIRDLDERGVSWRVFHDINFVDIRYKGFDARRWPVRDSGLLGPVNILSVRR